LNCQRYNLRVTNKRGNAANAKKRLNASSIYKGVSYIKKLNKWESYSGLEGKKIHIGNHDVEIDAALAYDKKARELFGEFARLNFPNGVNV
jgi:hypothetical protein